MLEFLVSVGLCTEAEGEYQVGVSRTHIEKGSVLTNRHHSNWRLKAIEHFERLGSEELAFTAPLTISERDAKAVYSELLESVARISERVSKSNSEKLYCLNIDWFES